MVHIQNQLAVKTSIYYSTLRYTVLHRAGLAAPLLFVEARSVFYNNIGYFSDLERLTQQPRSK